MRRQEGAHQNRCAGRSESVDSLARRSRLPPFVSILCGNSPSVVPSVAVNICPALLERTARVHHSLCNVSYTSRYRTSSCHAEGLRTEGSRGREIRVFHCLQGRNCLRFCLCLHFAYTCLCWRTRRSLRGILYPQHSGRRIVRHNVVPPLHCKTSCSSCSCPYRLRGLNSRDYILVEVGSCGLGLGGFSDSWLAVPVCPEFRWCRTYELLDLVESREFLRKAPEAPKAPPRLLPCAVQWQAVLSQFTVVSGLFPTLL